MIGNALDLWGKNMKLAILSGFPEISVALKWDQMPYSSSFLIYLWSEFVKCARSRSIALSCDQGLNSLCNFIGLIRGLSHTYMALTAIFSFRLVLKLVCIYSSLLFIASSKAICLIHPGKLKSITLGQQLGVLISLATSIMRNLGTLNLVSFTEDTGGLNMQKRIDMMHLRYPQNGKLLMLKPKRYGLSTRKTYLERGVNLSTILKDMHLILVRESGLGINHGNPRNLSNLPKPIFFFSVLCKHW
ncbi:hypothetical protein Goshw_011423, partial [Gossypium schwendimanii]|nr:hypothetical protein [Gossypium schwendimanii]